MYKIDEQGMPSDKGKGLYGVGSEKLRRGTLFKGTAEKASCEEYEDPREYRIIVGRNYSRIKADNT